MSISWARWVAGELASETTWLRTATTAAIIGAAALLGSFYADGAHPAMYAIQMLAYPGAVVAVWLACARAARPVPEPGPDSPALRALAQCLCATLYPAIVVAVAFVCARAVASSQMYDERPVWISPPDLVWIIGSVLAGFALRSLHRHHARPGHPTGGARRATLTAMLVLAIGTAGAGIGETRLWMEVLSETGTHDEPRWSWFGIPVSLLTWWTVTGVLCIGICAWSVARTAAGRASTGPWGVLLAILGLAFYGIPDLWGALLAYCVIGIMVVSAPVIGPAPHLEAGTGRTLFASVLALCTVGALAAWSVSGETPLGVRRTTAVTAILALVCYQTRDLILHATLLRAAPRETRIGAIWLVWVVLAWGVLGTTLTRMGVPVFLAALAAPPFAAIASTLMDAQSPEELVAVTSATAYAALVSLALAVAAYVGVARRGAKLVT